VDAQLCIVERECNDIPVFDDHGVMNCMGCRISNSPPQPCERNSRLALKDRVFLRLYNQSATFKVSLHLTRSKRLKTALSFGQRASRLEQFGDPARIGRPATRIVVEQFGD